MRHQEGHLIASDGLDLFFQVWLPDTPPKAVLLIAHGMGEHGGRYQNYVDYFAPRGCALYAADMRGCGRSGGKRGHVDRFDDFVDDFRRLHETAHAAQPDAPIVLLGHSYGSLIVLTYGLRYPNDVSGVISSGTALRDALPYPNWLRAVIRRVGRVLPNVSVPSGLKPEFISRDATVVTTYTADPLVHSVATLRWASEAAACREWIMAHAAEWSLPLLMLHGVDDRICLPAGARAFQEKASGNRIELRVYDGLYHEVHNERGKATVFRDVEAWLEARL